MKKMRLPIYIALCVCVIGLILGSFLDLSISQSIADTSNVFGLIISVIAPTLGFCGLAFAGGGFFAFALKQEWKVWIKVLFYVLAVAALGIATYFAGKEYFGPNGFNNDDLKIVGYIIAFVCALGAEVGGYFVFKDCKNKTAWVSLLIIYVVLLLVLVGGITILKAIMHRPRYRLVSQGVVPFHAWWERCSDYDTYITSLGESFKEEFKSFPSGHTGEAAILLVVSVFAPLAHDKLEKIQLPLFIGSGLFVLLVAFSRILVGAHYLSDVSFGALLTMLFTLLGNEIAINIRSLHKEEMA